MGKMRLKLLSIVKDDPIHWFFLSLVIAVFLFTRLLHINQVPPSVYWDEASIGYNAYSISHNLKDEWGEFLPLHFRAFGEFKLPVYIYSVVPFIKLFGLNEISVRLPAVLFSLISVLMVYLITRKLFGKQAALIAALFMTISPWYLIFSRTGYEVTAGLAFYLIAIYLFLFEKKWQFYLLATLFLILSLYSYNSFRIISPLVFLLVSLIKVRESLKTNLGMLLITSVLFFVALIPIARLFIYDAGSGRSQAFSLIPSLRQVYDINGKPRLQFIYERNDGVSWFEKFKQIADNYLSHFSPDFLLTGDKNPRSQIPGFGQVYLLDIFGVIFGTFYVIWKKKNLSILVLALLGIFPAVLFKESPHALRSLSSVPFLIILSTVGIVFITQKYKKINNILLPIIIIFYLVSFENYFMNFINSYPQISSNDWQYPYSEVFKEYKIDIDKADKVIITDEYAQPYIFALFYSVVTSSAYSKYDPSEFLKTRKLNPVDKWGFSTVKSFGKYEFRKIMASDFKSGTLLFVKPSEKPVFPSPSSVIKTLDGKEALLVYKL